MPAFEFATASRIVFGAGRLADAPALVRGLGPSRLLVVTGRRTERARALADAVGVAFVVVSVAGEPTVEDAREAVAAGAGCDAVCAIGGGSALDLGKAAAALLANGGDPLDHLEVVGRGLPLARPALPLVAIPTTAGTGSEVTRNAVLGVKDRRVKASLRSPSMLPAVALVDPDLLVGAPPELLAAGGMDALSQLVEPFLSARANPVTDALARAGIPRSARSLRGAVLGGVAGEDAAGAREDLALASLLGGLCLANSGLGAVHGFAAPMGGMFPAPHGAVCAALFPAVLEVNHAALRSRAPGHPALERYPELARMVTGDDDVTGLFAWARALVRELGIPGLDRWGLTDAEVPALVAAARRASSMKGNPIELTDGELHRIVEGSR